MVNQLKEIARDDGNGEELIWENDQIKHDKLKQGFQFLADMINRMAFLIITLMLFIAFAALYISTWTLYVTRKS